MSVPALNRTDDLGMAEAFGRDPILEAMIRKVVAEYGIETVIETGSWRGYTTRRFAEFVPFVNAIEIDPEVAAMARATLFDVPNAVVHQGDSALLLASFIPSLNPPVLYYLDAHWGEEWPLLNELDAIAKLSGPCVVVIHDCVVPGTDLGYDSYKGIPLTFEYVKPKLDQLKFSWRHFFNDDSAQGHRRGCLFVVPR